MTRLDPYRDDEDIARAMYDALSAVADLGFDAYVHPEPRWRPLDPIGFMGAHRFTGLASCRPARPAR